MAAPRITGNVPDTIEPIRARELTDRIKVAVDGTWLLIQEAYTSRAWAALGYASWDDYCTREFGTSRLRLPREERQEVVASLREIGMSVRAIAAATGHSDQTVQRDLKRGVVNHYTSRSEVRHDLDDVLRESGIDPDGLDDELNDDDTDEVQGDHFGPPQPTQEPRPIVGTDGKTYRPTPRPTGPQQRPALPPQFQSASADLSRVIARFERLREDDRYRSNRATITAHCLPEIRRAADVLHVLLSDLGHESGGPQ